MPDPEITVSPVQRVDRQSEARFREAIEWAKTAGRNVRVRCELRLYNPETQQYQLWPEASWTLDVLPQLELGTQLLSAYEAFINEMSARGPAAVVSKLTGDQTLE